MRETGPYKIKAGHVVEDASDQAAGRILNREGDVVCGGGQLYRVTSLQPAGKKAMDFASALNGGYIHLNEKL
jgi:methionyl-tRNA formyltransferase